MATCVPRSAEASDSGLGAAVGSPDVRHAGGIIVRDLRSALRSSLSRARRSVLRVLNDVRSRKSRGARTFEIAYVIPVSADVRHFMSRLQSDILKTHGTHPRFHAVPHITLKLGFDVPAIEPFEQYLDTLAADTEPFDIDLENIGFFDEGIVFLDVKWNPQFDRLRQRILSDLSTRHDIKPYRLEGDLYRPHATIAYDLSAAALADARVKLAGLAVRFRFAVETLALLCHTDGQWMTYKRAALARRQATP